jgi:hypothetical protein
MRTHRRTSNQQFSEPIVTNESTRLESVDDAPAFLKALPNNKVTVTIYLRPCRVLDQIDKTNVKNLQVAWSGR